MKIFFAIVLCLLAITSFKFVYHRKVAEQQLENEEKISSAQNNQILSDQEAREKFEKERREAQANREFNRSLGENTSDR